ncbi:MAG: hypothetical protein ACI9JL_000318 [Paracoccaceae bacterium]|jgi:hypothetical protein
MYRAFSRWRDSHRLVNSGMFTALPPYVRRLIAISAGFILIIGGLIFASELASGWGGLTYILFAMGAMALWAVICAIYSIVVLIRDGRRKSSIPALVILIAALAACAALFADRLT